MKEKEEVLRFCIGYIRKRKKIFVVIFILSILSSIIGIIRPYVFSQFIDYHLSGSKNMLFYILITLGLFLLSHIVDGLSKFFSTKYKNGLDYDLSYELLENVLRKPMDFFVKKNQGEILHVLLNEVDTIKILCCDTIILFFKYIFEFLLIVAVVMSFNKKMSIWIICLAPLVGLCQIRFKKITSDNQRKVKEKISVLSGDLNDSITGVLTIKTNNIYSYRLRGYIEKLKQVILAYNSIIVNDSLYNFIISFLMILPILFVQFWGGAGMAEGNLSVGEFTLVYSYTSRLLAPLSNISNLSISFNKACVSVQRYMDLLSEENDDEPHKIPNFIIESITMKNVSFSFDGKTKVLDDFSHTFLKNNVYHIQGPNGSGKTTFFYILLELFRKDHLEGDVFINSLYRLNTISRDYLCEHIAFVPQHSYLFNNTSLRENIFFDNDEEENKIIDLIEAFNVKELVNDNRLVQRNGENYSGGQKQKIVLLRALSRRSDVLILDEPFKELDYDSKIVLCNYIEKIKDDKIIIISSHEEVPIENMKVIKIGG